MNGSEKEKYFRDSQGFPHPTSEHKKHIEEEVKAAVENLGYKTKKSLRFKISIGILVSAGLLLLGSYFAKSYENNLPCPSSFENLDTSTQLFNPLHQDTCLDITHVSSPVRHGESEVSKQKPTLVQQQA